MFTNKLNKTATILRKTETRTPSGGVVDSWATNATYPTRYAKQAQSSVVAGTYKTTVGSHLFFFEVGVDILLQDEIQVDGRRFQVKSVDPFDGMTIAHHVEVSAEEVINA